MMTVRMTHLWHACAQGLVKRKRKWENSLTPRCVLMMETETEMEMEMEVEVEVELKLVLVLVLELRRPNWDGTRMSMTMTGDVSM